MKNKISSLPKTNAVRLLETKKIPFSLRTYPVDEEHLDAVTAARLLGLPPETVFKTLAARGNTAGIVIFCIPGSMELNLKKAAQHSGNKNIELLPVKELLEATGYIRGGCSPLGMKKLYPTFIDETALQFQAISISAGLRGLQILLKPEDLKASLNAEFCDLT